MGAWAARWPCPAARLTTISPWPSWPREPRPNTVDRGHYRHNLITYFGPATRGGSGRRSALGWELEVGHGGRFDGHDQRRGRGGLGPGPAQGHRGGPG